MKVYDFKIELSKCKPCFVLRRQCLLFCYQHLLNCDSSAKLYKKQKVSSTKNHLHSGLRREQIHSSTKIPDTFYGLLQFWVIFRMLQLIINNQIRMPAALFLYQVAFRAMERVYSINLSTWMFFDVIFVSQEDRIQLCFESSVCKTIIRRTEDLLGRIIANSTKTRQQQKNKEIRRLVKMTTKYEQLSTRLPSCS